MTCCVVFEWGQKTTEKKESEAGSHNGSHTGTGSWEIWCFATIWEYFRKGQTEGPRPDRAPHYPTHTNLRHVVSAHGPHRGTLPLPMLRGARWVPNMWFHSPCKAHAHRRLLWSVRGNPTWLYWSHQPCSSSDCSRPPVVHGAHFQKQLVFFSKSWSAFKILKRVTETRAGKPVNWQNASEETVKGNFLCPRANGQPFQIKTCINCFCSQDINKGSALLYYKHDSPKLSKSGTIFSHVIYLHKHTFHANAISPNECKFAQLNMF